ncbi:uncharacterized protein LOC100827555 [Brachypodium distachyon]|uniref:DUF538 family protein n=1 Tax=Brachypodium distachyon TaxID=15368 RepID=I1GTM9_BRADI|nr:uncharacterized protein LOC100827555 [Brachypodium distachyon]KQK15845.1 hypothetical protein BRADI_1g25270v3 [Brachypodium distachyon]|eukprot:XP_003562953.1 uncharacterized protein LOC100827555 [Brachypodium distachyon]
MAQPPPSPSRLALLTFLCLFLPALALAARAAPAADKTIHELLRSQGLPGGLLPRGVVSYTLQANGLLEARLSSSCYAKYDSGDLAFFDTVVRGNLSYGALRGCEGLAQEELFVWLPVKGILIAEPDSGVITFDIGYAKKKLSKSLFEEPPECKPSVSTELGAVEAARWRDRPGVPGLRMREAQRGGHQDQR